MRKIENAYYNLGAHLKNNFFDYNQSVDTYEEMLKRFNKTDYKLLVYMQLIFLYDVLGEVNPKQEILKKIHKDFPDNKYINTKTGELLTPKIIQAANDYDTIYDLYVNKKYDEAITLITQALQKSPSDSLNIKMIYAFCVSKQKGKKAFILELEKIKNQNPKTIQAEKSIELLDVLYGSFYETEQDLYKMEPDSEHHVIITVSDLKTDIPKLQSMLSKYNTTNFSDKKLQINNLLLNKETQIVKITNFKNSTEALTYYESTFNDPGWVDLYNQNGIDKMIISKTNFLSLLKEKTTKNYKVYFQKKYLN
jgi:tetratricopeptide (TPR) repeat protein